MIGILALLAAAPADASEHGAVELGAGVALRTFSARNELGTYDDDPLGSPTLRPTLEGDVRFAYRPVRRLWGETELSLLSTGTRDGDARALGGELAVNLLVDVLDEDSDSPVLPFGLVGAGWIATRSSDTRVLLSDVDGRLQVGGGARLFVTDAVGVRSDVRLVVPAGNRDVFAGRPESRATFAAFVRLGGAPEAPPPPPPVVDVDEDGLFPPDDACPDVPEDLDGFEDADGCPDLDDDADGIADADDACRLEPETLNGFEDGDGCPDTVPEVVTEFTGVIEGIQFDLDSAVIRPSSHGVLDAAVAVMLEYPSTRLEIGGHTDDLGGREYNLELSQSRAEAVRAYLVDHGVAGERLEARGYATDRPLDGGRPDNPANRRVEFQLIRGDQGAP